MKAVKLSSGAELKIGVVPFPDAKVLLQTFLEEAKTVQIAGWDSHYNLVKDVFCVALSSRKLEAALWPCMERSLYNGVKVDAALFENVKVREDFIEVCYLVAQETLQPFTKSLYARFKEIFAQIEKFQA